MYINWVLMTRNKKKLSTPNNRVIAPQSTCKSIKHQVSILPHWFIPLLLPLHLVRTSNSDTSVSWIVFTNSSWISGSLDEDLSVREQCADSQSTSLQPTLTNWHSISPSNYWFSGNSGTETPTKTAAVLLWSTRSLDNALRPMRFPWRVLERRAV